MPHGITQCYLPPGSGDISALTPAEAGTRLNFSDSTTFNNVSISHLRVRNPTAESVKRGAFSIRAQGWRRGVVVSGVRRMNEVNARRARLVPGWVTVFGRVYDLGM